MSTAILLPIAISPQKFFVWFGITIMMVSKGRLRNFSLILLSNIAYIGLGYMFTETLVIKIINKIKIKIIGPWNIYGYIFHFCCLKNTWIYLNFLFLVESILTNFTKNYKFRSQKIWIYAFTHIISSIASTFEIIILSTSNFD